MGVGVGVQKRAVVSYASERVTGRMKDGHDDGRGMRACDSDQPALIPMAKLDVTGIHVSGRHVPGSHQPCQRCSPDQVRLVSSPLPPSCSCSCLSPCLSPCLCSCPRPHVAAEGKKSISLNADTSSSMPLTLYVATVRNLQSILIRFVQLLYPTLGNPVYCNKYGEVEVRRSRSTSS